MMELMDFQVTERTAKDKLLPCTELAELTQNVIKVLVMSYEAYPSLLVTYHYCFRLTSAFVTDSACAGAGTYTEYFCENPRCRQ